MKSAVIQVVTFCFTMFILATGCADDKAREAAVQQAKESSAAESAAPAQTQEAQPQTVGTLHLSVPDKAAAKSSETCVSVTARDFNGIVSMQYSMKWDKEVLKFRRVDGFNLPGLGANNFGTQLADKEGILTYSWFDANIKGISRPDGAELYTVCFEVIGEAGSKSTIQFTDVPTVKEISNSSSQFLALDGTPGTVEVK